MTTQPTTSSTATSTPDVRLPASLALIAGVTDVTSWILLGGLFTAHITGNIVVIAANLVSGTPPRLASVLALPVFLLTTIVATLVARRFAGHRARTTRVLLGAQALLLSVAAALSFVGQASAHPNAPLAVTIGLCAVCAMAAQNAFLHLVPVTAPSTAVMTGNIVSATIAAVDLVTSRGTSPSARAKWHAAWPLLASFIGGCLVGAAASRVLGDHAAVVPALLALGLFSAITFREAEQTH